MAFAGCLSPEPARLLRVQGGVSVQNPGDKADSTSRHVRILAEQVRGRGRPQYWGGLRIHRPHRVDASAHMGASVLPPSPHPPALQAWT